MIFFFSEMIKRTVTLCLKLEARLTKRNGMQLFWKKTIVSVIVIFINAFFEHAKSKAILVLSYHLFINLFNNYL